jgi:hypothetical protein
MKSVKNTIYLNSYDKSIIDIRKKIDSKLEGFVDQEVTWLISDQILDLARDHIYEHIWGIQNEIN